MVIELLAGTRQKGETKRAVQACNDYLRMGPGRSLQKLCRLYADYRLEMPPTRHLNTLKRWSACFGWQERADEYDAAIEEQKNRRKREALENGLALDYERVIELKRLADLLTEQLYEGEEDGKYPNLWLADVRQIGSGKFAERVDLERFNAALIDQLRATLADLAAETGGRKQKVEHGGEDGQPIPITIVEVVKSYEDHDRPG